MVIEFIIQMTAMLNSHKWLKNENIQILLIRNSLTHLLLMVAPFQTKKQICEHYGGKG